MKNQHIEEVEEDNFSLLDLLKTMKSFFYYLLKRWWLFLVVVSIGGGLGFLYYANQKPKYEAVSTFILEDKSSMGGGIAGLASQFGFNLGSLGGSSSIFSGDNILNILKSKKVVQHVLLSHADDTLVNSKTLADSYLEFSGMKKRWQEMPFLKDIGFSAVNAKLSPLQDSVLNVIYETIIKKDLDTERPSKQGTIIKVKVTAANARFARLMNEGLVAEASRLYLDIRVGTAQENIRQLQRRSDSLLSLLNRKSYSAAASLPLDINPGIKAAAVPVEIANRDKVVIGTLYTEVTKNLEVSKVLLSQQTPIIQLLDQPGYLLQDNKKSLLILLIAGSLLGGALYVAGAFLSFQLSIVQRKKV